jgi:hypothetical protein
MIVYDQEKKAWASAAGKKEAEEKLIYGYDVFVYFY